MFGFGGASSRRQGVATLAAALPGIIGAMHPVERATVLVLANGMLRVVAEAVGGGSMVDDPSSVPTEVADGALKGLLAVRRRLSAVAEDPSSPSRRHAFCHLRAAELACLTVGVAVEPGAIKGCAMSWRAAWEGRTRLPDAVLYIRKWESASGVPAVAPAEGGSVGDDHLTSRGRRVPAFLRKGKGA
jgi:hypothetical protein